MWATGYWRGWHEAVAKREAHPFFLVVALITVLVISVLVRLNSGQSLMNLIVQQQTELLKETTQNYYIDNGTMNGFFDYYLQSSRPTPNSNQPNPANPPVKPPNTRDVRGLHGLVDANYRALIPTFGYSVGQTVPAAKIQQAIAVTVDGLTSASQALAGGNLGQQVPVTSQDELGQLTSTFNQMSADRVLADQRRKRLTADITHDLSTPSR